MAAEGDLNKINGDIWYAGDVTAVLNSMGLILKDYAQTIFNADYDGWDARLDGTGAPDFVNVDYDTFQTDTADTQTNISYNSTSDFYYTNYPDGSFTTLDEFNDSSINTGIWDTAVTGTASIAEAGTVITLAIGGGAGTATLTTDNDIFNTYANNIRINMATIALGGTQQLQLYDGSTTVVLATAFASSDLIDVSKIDSSNVKVRINGGAWSNKDISSLAGTIKLRFSISHSSPASFQVDWIRYSSDSITATLITDVAATASSTITNAILVVNNLDNVSGGADYYLSADNGANFEAVTLNQIHNFTNTGNQLKVKVEATGVSIYALDITVYEYLAKYNLH